MTAILRGLLFGAMVVFMGFSACTGSTPFEIYAGYRSAATDARQYELYTEGAYPSGADMADAYAARITMAVGDARHQLSVNAEHFTPTLVQIEGPVDLEYTVGQAIDPAFLAQFIMAVDPTISSEQASQEAQELFAVLEAAGMGPKIGLPATSALLLITTSSEYK